MSILWTLPFLAMLLCIALLPLLAPHWWEHNGNKLIVSGVLGLPVAVVWLIRHPKVLVATGEEYVSFMVLLAALYVITGGIRVSGDLEATPLTNTVFLATGFVLASVVGTTGASMLLTRPLLLGYLNGVPFWWTLRLWRFWVVAGAVLLLTYFVWDSIRHAREPLARLQRDRARRRPLRIEGGCNIPLLLATVAALALLQAPWRETVIVVLAGLAFWITPGRLRRANSFTAYPMVEVAVLFLGIFLTTIPALELLRARGGELDVRQPWQFFWATGLLSSFLDNAPTYLAFLALAQGLSLSNEVVGVPHVLLEANSVGAVFMGANTYIGNAPNFMVKSIAEGARVVMPSFFSYMSYTTTVLLPLFVLLTCLL